MKVEHLLAGVSVNPLNKKDIAIQVSHDLGSVISQDRPHVTTSNIKFRREDVKKVQALLNQAPGITEGIPYDIKITERGVTEVLNMYIDLMDGGFAMSKDGVNAGIKMIQSLDRLNDNAQAFTYESLYNDATPISLTVDGHTYTSYKAFFDSRFIYIPYILSTIPNYQDAFMALFAMTYVASELYKVIKSIIQWSTPSVGLGAVVHVAQLLVEIAFAVLLLATLIGLIVQLINCLIQPIKYHSAMLMSDLLKITAFKLGLEEQSSIYDHYPFNQVAYLPEKYAPVPPSNLTLKDAALTLMGINVGGFAASGYTSPNAAQKGYFNGIGSDFLALAKILINGKITMPDGTTDLVIERRDYYPANTPYKMPPIRQDWSEPNVDELSAIVKIDFAIDLNEKNSIDQYIGNRLEATHQQITTNDTRLVCLKGLREIQIAAARGVAKADLTFIEKAVKDVEHVWFQIEKVTFGIAETIVNGLIDYLNNITIPAINLIIKVWNALMAIVTAIVNIIEDIVGFLGSLFGKDWGKHFDGQILHIDPIKRIDHVHFDPMPAHDFSDRIQTLLLENDFVNVPKLLLVDTGRSEFKSRRIAYIHADNNKIINAQYLLDNFYCIDMFCDTKDALNGNKLVNNRYTKINPALNSPDEKNLLVLSLKDVKNLISNPKCQDAFGEEAIIDSIEWRPEDNGKADILYRKKKWLNDPQNRKSAKRNEEIYINLKLQTSLPNGN